MLGLEAVERVAAARASDAVGAEFETGTVTLALLNCPGARASRSRPTAVPIALQVDDVAAARADLEAKGVEFDDTIDSGVCHMAHFRDPDGNVAHAAPPLRAALSRRVTASPTRTLAGLDARAVDGGALLALLRDGAQHGGVALRGVRVEVDDHAARVAYVEPDPGAADPQLAADRAPPPGTRGPARR